MNRKEIKESVFSWIKAHCSYKNYLKFREKYRAITSGTKKLKFEDAYVCLENNTDRTYFILRMSYPIMGLMAVARSYLLTAIWAEKNGFIPLVDWEYEGDLLAGKLNCNNFWNEIFVQTENYDNIIKTGTVIAGTINKLECCEREIIKEINDNLNDETILWYAGIEGKNYYSKWKKWVEKYWKIQPDIIGEFIQTYGWLFKQSNRVLGVMMREEFSKKNKAEVQNEEHANILKIHPEVPSVEECIKYVEDYFEKWKCDYIFLSTIEESTVEEFQKKFGEKVVCVERKRNSENERNNKKKKDFFDMQDDEVKEAYPVSEIRNCNRGYMQEIYGLSKCNFLVGAACSGTLGALMLNGGEYEDTFIFPDYNPKSKYVQK